MCAVRSGKAFFYLICRVFCSRLKYFQKDMPDKYEKDMTVLMKAAAEVKVSSKKLKRYVITQRKVSEYALIAVSVL